MIQRCTNPNHEQFLDYGGRGITVCERWQGRNGFENFLADMGARPAGFALERKNNDKDYEPSNCKWASRIEQANNKRNNVRVDFAGKEVTMSELCRILRLNYNRFKHFYRVRGLAVPRAVVNSIQESTMNYKKPVTGGPLNDGEDKRH